MICKGSQRAGGLDLALHLLNERDNDHVEVHEIRGTAAQDLTGALLEIEASMACTKAEQAFFSVQLSPPKGSEMEHDTAAYERAASLIEKKYPDLAKQGRVIVFHEKEGRRHGHVVWSRIDTERMKAVDLSLFKLKLGDVSRAMFREYGLEMPAGYRNSRDADPRNYGLTMWQQCKRIGEDPRDLKRIVQEAFQHSDSRKAFAAALEGHALMLARGDKSGFVVVHHSGEALGLRQCLPKGTRIKEMRERIGHENECVTVDQAQSQLRARMTATAEKQVDDLKRRHGQENKPHRDAVLKLREGQRAERQHLREVQDARTALEERSRADRQRKGIVGLWDRLTGRRGRITEQNHTEAIAAYNRDLKQAQEQIKAQHEDRRQIQEQIDTLNARQISERNQARAVLGYWLSLDKDSARHVLQQHTAEIEREKESWKERQRDGSMHSVFKTEATSEQEHKKEEFMRDLKERAERTRDDRGMEPDL